MAEGYQPTSRRPIAGTFRATAGPAVRFCVRAGVHPDLISYLSIVASAIAAVCFWFSGAHPWLLLIAPLFCYLRLWFNMLDGMVALASGKASRRGEILNELPDRASDVMVFVAVAHSGLAHLPAGYGAAIGAILTAYVGTFGQAVADKREFGGIMSKPWRMVTLHVGAWLAFALLAFNQPASPLGLSVLDWTCVIIMVGCVQTIVVRLRSTIRLLNAAVPTLPADPQNGETSKLAR
jgi:phosphatidylglycerophosphate synthase